MERWFSGTSVVLFWGGLNTILAAVLAAFTASGTVGGPGPAGALAFIIYAVSATGVFLLGLAVWAGKRRRQAPDQPPRPAAAVLLATGVAMAWAGLAVGAWAAVLAVPVVVAAVVLEVYPHARP